MMKNNQNPNLKDACAEQMPFSTTRICMCCGRQLPADYFYMRDRQHTSDSYCKECRKAANRQRRKSKMYLSAAKEDVPGYVVITRVEQREARLELILHALQIVHQRIARQREKVHEEEFQKEWKEPLSFSEND